MQLRIKESAINDLSIFIEQYENALIKLYSDTGIWSEYVMLENLQKTTDTLFIDIFSEVRLRLSKKIVFGRKAPATFWTEISFYARKRMVIVFYSENTKEQVRWVESISIDRKPIIF